MRTLERIAPRALLVALPVGQAGDDFDRAFDDLLHLSQRRLNDQLDLRKCLGDLPIIPDALEPFGHRMLDHPANKRLHATVSCSTRSVRWERC